MLADQVPGKNDRALPHGQNCRKRGGGGTVLDNTGVAVRKRQGLPQPIDHDAFHLRGGGGNLPKHALRGDRGDQHLGDHRRRRRIRWEVGKETGGCQCVIPGNTTRSKSAMMASIGSPFDGGAEARARAVSPGFVCARTGKSRPDAGHAKPLPAQRKLAEKIQPCRPARRRAAKSSLRSCRRGSRPRSMQILQRLRGPEN